MRTGEVTPAVERTAEKHPNESIRRRQNKMAIGPHFHHKIFSSKRFIFHFNSTNKIAGSAVKIIQNPLLILDYSLWGYVKSLVFGPLECQH